MSLMEIIPLVESLPHADKFHLMQSLLTQLAHEEGVPLQALPEQNVGQGERMAAILQHMADSHALPHITDPVAWQRGIREDRLLPDRE